MRLCTCITLKVLTRCAFKNHKKAYTYNIHFQNSLSDMDRLRIIWGIKNGPKSVGVTVNPENRHQFKYGEYEEWKATMVVLD